MYANVFGYFCIVPNRYLDLISFSSNVVSYLHDHRRRGVQIRTRKLLHARHLFQIQTVKWERRLVLKIQNFMFIQDLLEECKLYLFVCFTVVNNTSLICFVFFLFFCQTINRMVLIQNVLNKNFNAIV